MDDIDRVYWSIGDAAKALHTLTHQLREWERKLDWIVIKKDKRGNRQYTESSLQDIVNIHVLVRNGMVIKGIKKAYREDYFQELLEFFKDKEKIKKGIK